MAQDTRLRDIRHFQSGSGMNLDDDARTLKPNEHREIWNSIIGVSESAHASCLENIKGTVSVFDMPINAGLDVRSGLRAVGMCEDVADNAVVIHLMDTTGDGNHAIMRYHNSNSRCEWILKDEPLLNYQSGHPVISNLIGDLLYWTDGYFGSFLNNDFNPPRKINIVKAMAYTAAKNSPDKWDFYAAREAYSLISQYEGYTIYIGTSAAPSSFFGSLKVVAWALDGINRDKIVTGYGEVLDNGWIGSGTYYVVTNRPFQGDTDHVSGAGHIMSYEPGMYFGIDWQVMDVIKHPPTFAPTCSYDSDDSVKSNQIGNNIFQFSYRYVYADNEKSVLSPVSEILFNSLINSSSGVNYQDQTINNKIIVWFSTGPTDVIAIELFVRIGNIGQWFSIYKLSKYDNYGNIILESDIFSRYDFYNSEAYMSADQTDLSRPFDFVPIIASGQELIEKNRILYSDYTEGYDNINIDVKLTNTQSSIQPLPTYETMSSFTLLRIFPTSNFGNSFWAGYIEFDGFWQPGFEYSVYISLVPGKYDNPEGVEVGGSFQTLEFIYGDYLNKKIVAIANVDSQLGSTFEDFSNSVCAQLRQGNGLDSAVIALNRYDYPGFNNYNGFFSYPDHPFPPPMFTIGFVIELTAGQPCVYSSYAKVEIIKTENKLCESTFKSGVKHQFGLMYFDRASRFGSINKSDDSFINTPSQVDSGYTLRLLKNTISWEINHIPPAEATHYCWAYAKNSSITYSLMVTMSKLEVENTTNSLFICVNQYIILANENIKNLNISAYTWQKGDRVRFIANYVNGDWYTIPSNLDYEIIGTFTPQDQVGGGDTYLKNDLGEFITDNDGNKIKDEKQVGFIIPFFAYDLYNILIDKTVIEIYRPKKTLEESIYFEFGQILPILDPNTESRRHSGGYLGVDQIIQNGISTAPARGVFKTGDAFLRYRSIINFFPCESFEYSDFFNSDVMSIGKPNAVNPNMRNQRYISNLRYGGLYIENTQVNELSKFKAEDFIALPEKFGPINFIKEIGFTLKVIQKYKPSSIYIGRQGLTQADVSRGEVLYASNNTLGTVTINPNSNYGTEHPLSCIPHEGNLYGYCINSGVIWRNSGNGIRSISQPEVGDNDSGYKIKVLTQTKSRTFATHDVEVFAAYDSRYDIVYFCFVDATDTSESYTIGFHEPSNRWVSFYSFIPEFIGAMKMTTLSWKLSNLWLHNEGTRMNFYGQQYNQLVKAVSNIQPLLKKRFLALTENASGVWHLGTQGDVYIPPDDTYRRGQTSLVKAGAFRDIEGTIYAPFGKNMTTHQLLPTNDDFINGDDLRGNFIELTLRNESTEETNLFSIEVDSVVSNP